MRRKKRKKDMTPRELLEDKLEQVQREAVRRRDKDCVLFGLYQHDCGPLRQDGEKILQADHLISGRKQTAKAIFFDLKNLNLVCKNVNGTKGFQGYGWEEIQRKLERITEKRYGEGTVADLEQRRKQVFKPDILWLEEKINEYERMYR